MKVSLSPDQLEAFHRDGYTVVRGLFTADEIARLREGAYAAAAEAGMRPEDPASVPGFALPGDLASHPQLCHLVTDERLVSLAEQLLGAPPVHFRDSAVGIGGSERGWHKDNRNSDRYDTGTPDWHGDYPLIRMGIYCEDHAAHSGGLAVRVGSHRPERTARQRFAQARWGLVRKVRDGVLIRTLASGMLAKGKPVHVATRPGDVVAWNMRITHSGHSVRPRGLAKVKLPPFVEQRLPKALVRGEEKTRVAIFLSYGAQSPHLARYVEWLKTRAYFPPRTKDRPMCDDLAEGAAVEIRDPWHDAEFVTL